MRELARGVHNRHRHPQHAAGRPGLRLDRRDDDVRGPRRRDDRVRGRRSDVFTNPKEKRTEDYITGRFG